MQVFGYTAYLVWSALTSEPVPATCIRELGKGSTGIKVSSPVQSQCMAGVVLKPQCSQVCYIAGSSMQHTWVVMRLD